MAIGVVDNAVPMGVLPWHLCASFKRSQNFPILMNEYRNGESQRVTEGTISRKGWELSLRLTADQLDELRTFHVEHKGSLIPFTFYDVSETVGFDYDDTGVSVTGQYTVRFDGPWEQSVGIGSLRGSAGIRLIEVG